MGICRRDLGRLALAGAASRLLALPARPKLLVIVVLGQFRPEYLDSARTQLSPGGFRKFFDRGAVYYNCLNRGTTFPCSSLATLATGSWPAQHGVVADRWYDRGARIAVPAGPETMIGGTLLSEIAADPRARVAVVGGSLQQASLFAAGVPPAEDPQLFWMDPEGRFVSNGEPPDWLANFRSPNSAEAARDAKWLALGARADAPPLRTLTWTPSAPADYMALYRSSPFAQAALFDLAAEVSARYRFGQSNTFDVLCIIPDAMERLGYETGARSPLMQQMVLHLDRRIEALFAQLAKIPGENQYVFALAGAHGVPPEPPADARERMAVHGERLAQAIQTAFPHVEKYIYPFLYLRPPHVPAESEAEGNRLNAARVALSQPPVAGYYTAGGACSVHDEWERRFRNSFHPVRSGDVMLSYRPGYIESAGFDRGISYGSLYNYDARVPLCFYGPAFRPGIYEQTVELVDFAPTLARIAGVATPSFSSGRVLGEAMLE